MYIAHAESPCHQAVAQIHQHMDQCADQISQESGEGILRVRVDPQHQQMHVSECVGTRVSSHVLEASSPVKSWCYGDTAGCTFSGWKISSIQERARRYCEWRTNFDRNSWFDLLEDLVSLSSKMLVGSNCQHTSATCRQELEMRMKIKEMRSAVLPSLLSISQCHPTTEGPTTLSVPLNVQKTHCKNCPIFIVAPLAWAISLPGSTGKYWDRRVDSTQPSVLLSGKSKMLHLLPDELRKYVSNYAATKNIFSPIFVK